VLRTPQHTSSCSALTNSYTNHVATQARQQFWNIIIFMKLVCAVKTCSLIIFMKQVYAVKTCSLTRCHAMMYQHATWSQSKDVLLLSQVKDTCLSIGKHAGRLTRTRGKANLLLDKSNINTS